MKLRYRATLTMLVAILILSAFSGYLNYRGNVQLIESGMQKNLKTVSTIIQVDIDTRAAKAASLASFVANEPTVIEAVRTKDRALLHKTVVPPFLIQKEKFGVIDGHFHTVPATSFFRTYKPDIFGDDLSTYRELILAVQKQQRPLQGVEISRTGVSIKGLDVIKAQNEMVGTLEVGVSLDSSMENVKKITGFEAAVFVDNQKMTQFATSAPVPDPERIIAGYRTVFATNWDVIRRIVTPQQMSTVNDITYRVTRVRDQFDGLVIVPLLDFKGEQIGSIWAVGDFSQYQKELRTSLVLSVAFAILQSILLSAIVLIVFSSFFLLPMDDLTEKLRQLSEGKTEEADKAAIWSERKDELGSLARSIQKLSQLVKNQKS